MGLRLNNDGTIQVPQDYAAQHHRKVAFPAAEVYPASRTLGPRLITYTGVFDRASGHYESKLVLSARLASSPSTIRLPVPAPRPGRHRPPLATDPGWGSAR